MGNQTVLVWSSLVNRPCGARKWPLFWSSRPNHGSKIVKNSQKVVSTMGFPFVLVTDGPTFGLFLTTFDP